MATSSQSFVTTMVLNALISMMFLPLTASQCMDYEGMKSCFSAVSYSAVTKDLLECINDCLVKPGKVCRFIQWKPQAKLCHVGTAFTTFHNGGNCATFRKRACDTIPDDGSLEEDSGNLFKGGQHMTFVTKLEECKTICAIGRTCLAFIWLGRCVVLNAGGNSGHGRKEQNAYSLQRCVETVLNTSRVNRVDWNFGSRECWSHKGYGITNFHPVEGLMQLRKNEGCRLWQGAVHLQKLENTKMSGGLKLKGLSEQECVELCQLVSNCAAVGWSGTLSKCTFHHLELSTEEDPLTTLYTTGGAGISTSTTTVSTSTAITTISTSTEATTAAPTGGTGTVLGAYFIRRDNNQLTSKSQRRASLECAMLCFRSNCSDFTSAILNDDSVCGMSGSQTPGRSPKKLFEWIKLDKTRFETGAVLFRH